MWVHDSMQRLDLLTRKRRSWRKLLKISAKRYIAQGKVLLSD
jgi:hypothetical protein